MDQILLGVYTFSNIRSDTPDFVLYGNVSYSFYT